MTTYLQRYMGQFALTTAMRDFTLDWGSGPTAVVLTTGNYYIAGYTGETSQLCEHMQTKIRAIAGNPYPNATVTYSTTTDLITISLTDQTTTSIAWTDVALQTLLGFTGAQTGANTYTASYKPYYTWHPSQALWDFPGDLNVLWASDSSSRVTVAPDGTTVTREGSLTYDADLFYCLLDKDEVIDRSGNTTRTFEHLWTTVVHTGKPLRVFPVDTANTSADYVTALMIPPDADVKGEGGIAVGAFKEFRSRHVGEYNGLWDVRFRLVKKV